MGKSRELIGLSIVVAALVAVLVAAGHGRLRAEQAARPGVARHMVYDSLRRQLLLLATSDQSRLEELWTWNGARWTSVGAAGPAPRELSGVAFDTRRGRLVLFGGMGLSPSSLRRGDVWEWDGETWREMSSAGSGTRDHHAMAFDEKRGRSVVYGGQDASRAWMTDTREWDGTTWTTKTASGPDPRVHTALGYDSARDHVVLFGGVGADYRTRGDTWAWNGDTWQRLSADGPARSHHGSLAFDSATGTVVLFGGLADGRSGSMLGDTWLWNGTTWIEQQVPGPPKRSGHVMAYDPVTRRTFLYGGSAFDGTVATRYSDTWTWDGRRWMQVD